MEQKLITSNSPAMSEDIRALVSALLLAKQEFKPTGLSGENTFQKLKYAKIGDIYKAVEDALGKNGIIIAHWNRPSFAEATADRPDAGIEYCYTRLIHNVTGQYIEDCRIQESEKPGNQAKGSANTYMKKYAILSLCAIATEDDDDGQDEEKYSAKKQSGPDLINSQESKQLQDLLTSCKNGKLLYTNILKSNNIQNISQLQYSSFDAVRAYIEKNRE